MNSPGRTGDTPLISVCMIVRDEENVLGRCLRSVSPHVDEVIVADQGSRDRTVEIARDLGAQVELDRWADDFSAARNRALERATGRFVLVLDADEWLESSDAVEALRDRLETTEQEAFRVTLRDRLDGDQERSCALVRLFRNRPEHRYEGIVHEQIVPAIARRMGVESLDPADSGLVIGHDGYRLENRRRGGKHRRNRDLLERRLADDPHDHVARYFLLRETVPMKAGRAVPGGHLAVALGHAEILTANLGALPETLAADSIRLLAAARIAAGDADRALETLREQDDGVSFRVLRVEAELAREPIRRGALATATRELIDAFDRTDSGRLPAVDPALSGPVARTVAARAYLAMGCPADARELLRDARELPGGQAPAFLADAEIARRESDVRAALEGYVAAARCDPHDPRAWAGLGLILLESGGAMQSIEPLSNAARLAPGWSDAEEGLAAACLIAGSLEGLAALGAPAGGSPSSPDPVRDSETAAREPRPAAYAARLLAGDASTAPASVGEKDAEIRDAADRILRKIEAAGRPELVQRFRENLASAVSSRSLVGRMD